jgi:hypothetical protein
VIPSYGLHGDRYLLGHWNRYERAVGYGIEDHEEKDQSLGGVDSSGVAHNSCPIPGGSNDQ